MQDTPCSSGDESADGHLLAALMRRFERTVTAHNPARSP